MAITTAQAYSLLFPGLREITGRYEEIPTRWDKIFEKGASKLALERSVETRLMGRARLKTEGGAKAFDNNAGVRFTYNQEHREWALGYAVTRPMIDDNLYESAFNTSNLGLQESFAQTKEIEGASILNTGNVYDAKIGGDGKALFATDHPIDGASIANTPTVQVELNEGTLLNAMTVIRSTFRDQAGLLKMAQARKLVVPPSLEPVAVRLTKTELRPGTSDNDVNAIGYVAGGLPDGYVVNEFLTSTKAWFLLTNIKGLLYLSRIPFEMDMTVDDVTDNLLVMGYERYSFSYYDWRAAYASFPT